VPFIEISFPYLLYKYVPERESPAFRSFISIGMVLSNVPSYCLVNSFANDELLDEEGILADACELGFEEQAQTQTDAIITMVRVKILVFVIDGSSSPGSPNTILKTVEQAKESMKSAVSAVPYSANRFAHA